MKKYLLFLVGFSFLLASCNDESEIDELQNSCENIAFKYYNGNKDSLGVVSNDYLLIACDTSHMANEIHDFISSLNYFDKDYNYTIHAFSNYKFKEIPLKLKSSLDCEEIPTIISELKQKKIIAYIHRTIQTDNCQNLIWEPIGNLCIDCYSSLFYVKVFDDSDLTDLNRIITETNTEMVRQNEFMEKWFTLRATKSSNGDALEMANYFYETGFFEASEPDITKYPVE